MDQLVGQNRSQCIGRPQADPGSSGSKTVGRQNAEHCRRVDRTGHHRSHPAATPGASGGDQCGRHAGSVWRLAADGFAAARLVRQMPACAATDSGPRVDPRSPGRSVGRAAGIGSAAIWWFHPLVWWANREPAASERPCDEKSWPAWDAGPRLRPLAVGRARGTRHAAINRSLTIAMFGVTARRLEHIIRRASRFHRRTPLAYYLLALLALALLLPGPDRSCRSSPAKATADADATSRRQDRGRSRRAASPIGGPSFRRAFRDRGRRDIWVLLDENWQGKEADLALFDQVIRWEKSISACSWATSRRKLFSPQAPGRARADRFYELSQQHLKELTHLPNAAS